MKLNISTAAQLGELVRATRKSNNIRLDDVASMAGLGPVFVGDVEYGKETVQLGRVLQLLQELGIHLIADVPDSVMPQLEKIRAQGGLVRPSHRKAKRIIAA